jgi:NAD(P)-dependent dehydrogenase (short-subunit alcohol dehydrogenase family)
LNVQFEGRVVAITGAAGGIGKELCRHFGRQGAAVAALDRRDAVTSFADELRGSGIRAESAVVDVGDAPRVAAAFARLVGLLGPIDILINNAGGRRENIPTQDMPLDTWRALIDLNLTSVFVCTKVLGGAMIARGRGGRVINIASINALVAGRKIAGRHYETAKAAVVQFTRAVAADWAPHGVTVNAILPGGFMTDANRRWQGLHPEVIEEFRQQIPMGEFGTPEDLGPLAVYLASSASRYMTGAALVIDGGYTLW